MSGLLDFEARIQTEGLVCKRGVLVDVVPQFRWEVQEG